MIMSIDSGFYRRERNVGNDTYQVRESERKSNNPYESSYDNSSYRDNRSPEQKHEEATLKLQYYQDHYEELTKDATVGQLQQLSFEIQKLQSQVKMYEMQQRAEEMRGKRF